MELKNSDNGDLDCRAVPVMPENNQGFAKYLSNPWLALILIMLVTLLIYSNIYTAPFVFDDLPQIEDKSTIRDLEIFSSPRTVLSHSPRPVVELSFALNYRLGKLNVFGYHLVNVTIHIINGFLAYILSLVIFKQLFNSPAQKFGHSNSSNSKLQSSKSQVDPKLRTYNLEARTSKVVLDSVQSTIGNQQSSIYLISLFTALIFVAHPIQTQAVTYTVQRYTSMAAMFYFLSVICYLKGRIIQQSAGDRGQRGVSGQWSVVSGQEEEARSLKTIKARGDRILSALRFQPVALYALCFLCGFLAFLSKESSVSLPGTILLVEYILFDRTWRGWKVKLLWFLPAFAIFGIFFLYVYGFFRGEVQFGKLLEDVSEMMRAPGTVISRWDYLCTQFNVVVIYVGLLFLPVGQNLDYMYPLKTGFFDGYTPLAFLILILIVGIGIWNIKKRPIITFGILWFFITLSVESSIFPIKDVLFEHRLYLSMFGFALVIAYVVFCLLPIKQLGHVVVSILIVASLGTATYLRNMVYQDGVTLWSDVVAKSPKNFRAHYNLGNALRADRRQKEAIKSYSMSLILKPDYIKARDNLGVVLTEVGRLDDAIKNFSDALKTRPNDPLLHCNLGLALMRKGDFRDAVDHFSEALRIKPAYTKAHSNLGITLAQQGNLKDAIVHFSEALRTEPDNVKILSNLGQALMLQGNFPEAVLHYSKAVRIKPDYAEAHSKLGLVLVLQGDLDGGIEHFTEALQIKPGLAEARQGLNRALRFKGSKNPPYR